MGLWTGGADTIRTTVIGSHPVAGEGLEAVRNAVLDQLEAGVDLISDGQTRKDMVSYFADHIQGFKVEEGRSYIVGKIRPPEETPVLGDLAFAKGVAGDRAEVKAIITGPVTMAFFSELTPTAPYRGFRDESLYKDLGEALAIEAELLQRGGFLNIQFDEPSFSIGAPMTLAKKALEICLSGLRGTKALHVCGNLRGAFKEIAGIDGLDVLNFAFKDSLSNFDTVDRKLLEDHSKRVGVGCVSSTENTVEDVTTIKGIMKKALERFGPDSIAWVNPDCGLRELERETVRAKLKHMVIARKEMESDFG
jgi:5-methyltetrahydropteroyltriglutamate--homocysteine methyltransferase